MIPNLFDLFRKVFRDSMMEDLQARHFWLLREYKKICDLVVDEQVKVLVRERTNLADKITQEVKSM